MPRLQPDLWREASRADDLTESVHRMAQLMGRHVLLRALVVRHYDPAAHAMQTLAVGLRAALHSGPGAASACPPALAARLLADAGDRVVPLAPPDPLGSAVVPPGLVGTAYAGALRHPDGTLLGVLVVVPGETPDAAALARLADSLDPFAAALAHHLRVHELDRLREAAEAENEALRARLGRREIVEEIVGADGSLRGVLTRVAQVAATDAPVLILGETGTGKEVIARAIHGRSSRADGPIVRVNCGAIPTELVDSELFGHEKGAFTGAIAPRKGWFERADGGTLFLDEIGDLPLAAQVRLLRILQDGTYERVGGQQTRRVDVRLLAATHRDMETLVAGGLFREDLWYRISVFPLYLPPLRARTADLPALAHHFAQAASHRLGVAALEVDPDDLALMLDYPWPGNVRELAAVVERAAILGGGHRLDVRGAMGTKLHALRERTALADDLDGPFPTLDEAMQRHIERALQRCHGRIEGSNGAAALLGINPHTLRGRMRKLGVAWSAFRG